MGEVDGEAMEMNGWVVQTDSRECLSLNTLKLQSGE